MHSISPYSVRCFNQNLPSKDKYCTLNKVGSKDALVLLHEFIKPRCNSLSNYTKTKQAYYFSNINFDEKERRLSGWFNVGNHGMAGDIINIKTGKKDFRKTIDNADMIQHYFQFYLPLDVNEGFCIFHSYRGHGVKTLFCNIFSPYFFQQTSLNIGLNPLAYEKAFQDWTDANVKELHVTSFNGVKDIADSIKNLGHHEAKLTLTPKKRGGCFGKLSDLKTKGTDQFRLVEILNSLGSQTKTVVELNGKRRTFIVGKNENNPICQIELDEKVKMEHGLPEFESLHLWVNDILSEYSKKMYPKRSAKS
jgi:hypothetical protein